MPADWLPYTRPEGREKQILHIEDGGGKYGLMAGTVAHQCLAMLSEFVQRQAQLK